VTADPWSSSTFGAEALSWSPGLAWQDSALCKQVGPDLFHTEKPGEAASVNMAKSVCNGSQKNATEPCPVKDACLAWAFEVGDGWAVLGGTSPRQRQRMRTEERRATGGRVRCRICRCLYTPTAAQQMDCSDACRLVSRRRREARRRTQ
jgi:WhiB family redox-sensing transcriptional regulator